MVDADTAFPARTSRADHVCWVYEDHAEFWQHAVAYLTAGIVAGDRLEYLGSGGLVETRERLRAVPGFDVLLDSGRLGVRSLEDNYGVDQTDPGVPVKAYAAATEAALAEGYGGLRVVAEATALVRTPAQREHFGRYEHLIDRYMLHHPFSAMCAYDVRELGSAAVAQIACLHPRVSPGATAFQWYAASGADVELTGEIDITSQDAFDVTLARTIPLMGHPRITVDARALEFIDHRGILSLDRHARGAGAEITLLTDARIVHRLAEFLDLRAVRPEPAR